MKLHSGRPNLLLPLLLLGSTSFLIFLPSMAFAAIPKLDIDEVKALKEIGKKLGRKEWDFGVDPCSGKGKWNVTDERKGSASSVMCDCSFNNNSSCHVVSMYYCYSLLPPHHAFRRHRESDSSE